MFWVGAMIDPPLNKSIESRWQQSVKSYQPPIIAENNLFTAEAQRAQRMTFFVCRETTTNKNISLLKTKSFAQSSSPDWAKILTSAYSASLR